MKRIVVGRPMASDELDETLLSKFLALPIFASDPLSSVAYATEAAMVVLVGVSLGALHWVIPISVAIALLLAIVALSYGRPCAPTRRAAARTSSRRRTSARSRASSPAPRCSPTTC